MYLKLIHNLTNFGDRLSKLDVEKRPLKSPHYEKYFFNDGKCRKREQSSDMHKMQMPAAKEQRCNQSAVYRPVSPACNK